MRLHFNSLRAKTLRAANPPVKPLDGMLLEISWLSVARTSKSHFD